MKSSVRTFCSKGFRHWYYEHELSNLMKKCAFTLAEVLITLGIIGVVAAITLPILIQNYQKTVWVNQLKKSVSVLENGFKLAMAEDEVDNLEDTALFRTLKEDGGGCVDIFEYSDGNGFENEFKKYFKVVKYANGYWENNYKDLDGEVYENDEDATLVNLYDGTKLFLQLNGCYFRQIYYGHQKIDIDVNGDKNPNQWGRDRFSFILESNGRLTPKSYALRIIENGWKMDY